MNRLTNFCASDLLSHVHLVLHGNLGQISLSGSSGTAENNYAQCFTIVHVIVILADKGGKSVLVVRVHFYLKLKNQFMKMHLFHVHVRYVYYLLNQKKLSYQVFSFIQANCKNVIWRFAVRNCHMGKRLVIRYQI